MKHVVQRCLLLIALVALAACGNSNGSAQQSGAASSVAVASTASSPSAAASEPARASVSAASSVAPSVAASPSSGPTAVPTPGPDQFVNPVIGLDFPDPDTLKVGDTYYAYATQGNSSIFQSARSSDLVTWEMLGDAMPGPPTWTKPGPFYWAPEVTTWDDGKTFVMYFTARDTESDKQCIGVATADKPEGPFNSAADKPIICPAEVGGAIDAASFTDDDGTRYILWKNDGNCCGFDTFLHIQKVSADGLTLEGEPTQLIKQDQGWEGLLVEAPTLWKHNGKYYLFYSANNYAGIDYAMGYAVADNVLGPYTKPQNKPFMSTDLQNGGALGPGGQDIIVDKDGDTWMMYHTWDPSATFRGVQIDELVWEGDVPVVKGPDKIPQPKP